MEFNGLSHFNSGSQTFTSNDTYLHLIRHPAAMLVSGYLYHRRCPEPWTRERVDFGVAKPSPASNLFLGSPRERAKLLAVFAAGAPANEPQNASYCQLLQAVNASMGLRAEALRSMTAADGVRRMLVDRSRLQTYARSHNRPQDTHSDSSVSTAVPARSLPAGPRLPRPKGQFKRLIELCVSDVTPPDTPQAAASWEGLAKELAVSSSVFTTRFMGQRYEQHRSRGSDCERQALSRLANEVLLEHSRWLANLHGYRSVEEATVMLRRRQGRQTAIWERMVGGPCENEEVHAVGCNGGTSVPPRPPAGFLRALSNSRGLYFA